MSELFRFVAEITNIPQDAQFILNEKGMLILSINESV